MAATAILDLNLHSVTMASKMQTTMERESEAGRAAREAGYEESEPEHELHGAAPNMLAAMFPSMDLEVLTTVLAWNGGDVELAASSILDMWSDHHNSATTPDDGALARVLQRSLEVEVATGDQQLQNDEETARALQLAWDAEEQEEKKEQEEEQLARCSNGSRPPPPRAPQNSRAKMLAFLRARGTASTTRFTVRLLDGDDLPREITPLAGESALLAGHAPPPPATIASAEAAAVVALADAMATGACLTRGQLRRAVGDTPETGAYSEGGHGRVGWAAAPWPELTVAVEARGSRNGRGGWVKVVVRHAVGACR